MTCRGCGCCLEVLVSSMDGRAFYWSRCSNWRCYLYGRINCHGFTTPVTALRALGDAGRAGR